MPTSLQDGAKAHIENSSVHFLRSVFGDNNNSDDVTSSLVRYEPVCFLTVGQGQGLGAP
jgi:hypothetical protein